MWLSRISMCIGLVAMTGCGLGLFDERQGGSDDLPTQAVGPYGKPPIDFDTDAEEPFVLTDRNASLWNPSALLREGGGFRIWYGRELVEGPVGESEIWVFGLASITELPDEVETLVLSPGAAWEQGRVASPSVIDRGNGHLVMLYEGGIANPAIGRADSMDNGATWQKHASNPLLTNAFAPGLGEIEGSWYVFYTGTTGMGILLAESDDGVSWTSRPDPVILPRTQLRFAFDNLAVSDPYPVIDRTPAGQLHFGLFYNAENVDGDVTIGYAGSLDGEVWESFSLEDPVVDAGGPHEHGPTVLRTSSRGVMFFSEARLGRQRIAVATHPQ